MTMRLLDRGADMWTEKPSRFWSSRGWTQNRISMVRHASMMIIGSSKRSSLSMNWHIRKVKSSHFRIVIYGSTIWLLSSMISSRTTGRNGWLVTYDVGAELLGTTTSSQNSASPLILTWRIMLVWSHLITPRQLNFWQCLFSIRII